MNMENPFEYVKNIIDNQNTKKDEDKLLKNLINNKHISINLSDPPKTGFVNENIKLFIE